MDLTQEDLEKDYPGSPLDDGVDIDPVKAQIAPNELEVERALLGAMLTDPESTIPLVLETNLKADDFFNQSHGLIYLTILNLYNDNKGVDLLLLKTRLEQDRLLDRVGGAAYLSQISEFYGVNENVSDYASLNIDR
jgi:replicative DNA helicase